MKEANNRMLLEAVEARTNLKHQYLVSASVSDIDGVNLTLCSDMMPMPLHTDNVVAALSVLNSVEYVVYGVICTVGKKLRIQSRSNRTDIIASHCWLQLKDGSQVDPSIQSQPYIFGHEIDLENRMYFEAFKVSPEDLEVISKSILPPKLVGVVGIPLEGFANLSSHSVYFK